MNTNINKFIEFLDDCIIDLEIANEGYEEPLSLDEMPFTDEFKTAKKAIINDMLAPYNLALQNKWYNQGSSLSSHLQDCHIYNNSKINVSRREIVSYFYDFVNIEKLIYETTMKFSGNLALKMKNVHNQYNFNVDTGNIIGFYVYRTDLLSDRGIIALGKNTTCFKVAYRRYNINSIEKLRITSAFPIAYKTFNAKPKEKSKKKFKEYNENLIKNHAFDFAVNKYGDIVDIPEY